MGAGPGQVQLSNSASLHMSAMSHCISLKGVFNCRPPTLYLSLTSEVIATQVFQHFPVVVTKWVGCFNGQDLSTSRLFK